MKTLLALVVLCVLCGRCLAADKPNVLLIISDDLRTRSAATATPPLRLRTSTAWPA